MTYTSAFKLFEPSKQAVLKNLSSFGAIIFLPMILPAIGDLIGAASSWPFTAPPTGASSAAIALYVIGFLLSLIFYPAGIYLEVQAAQGKTIDAMTAIKHSLKYFWRIYGLTILVGLIVLLGILALVVPGIIFIRRYFLSPYFLVDKDLSIGEAMKQSAAATKGKAGAVWGIIGVMILLSLSGIVPFIGGLLSGVLITLYTCAPALRYLELKNTAKV